MLNLEHTLPILALWYAIRSHDGAYCFKSTYLPLILIYFNINIAVFTQQLKSVHFMKGVGIPKIKKYRQLGHATGKMGVTFL